MNKLLLIKKQVIWNLLLEFYWWNNVKILIIWLLKNHNQNCKKPNLWNRLFQTHQISKLPRFQYNLFKLFQTWLVNHLRSLQTCQYLIMLKMKFIWNIYLRRPKLNKFLILTRLNNYKFKFLKNNNKNIKTKYITKNLFLIKFFRGCILDQI